MLDKEIVKIFPILENLFSYDDFIEFKNCKSEELWQYHFGLGTWIRNNIIHKDSILYKLFLESGVVDMDDMSSVITHKFHNRVWGFEDRA